MKPVKAWALVGKNGRIKSVISYCGTMKWIGASRAELNDWRCAFEDVVRVEVREVPREIKPETISHERVPVLPRRVLVYRPVVTPKGALPRSARRGLAEKGGEHE